MEVSNQAVVYFRKLIHSRTEINLDESLVREALTVAYALDLSTLDHQKETLQTILNTTQSELQRESALLSGLTRILPSELKFQRFSCPRCGKTENVVSYEDNSWCISCLWESKKPAEDLSADSEQNL